VRRAGMRTGRRAYTTRFNGNLNRRTGGNIGAGKFLNHSTESFLGFGTGGGGTSGIE